MNLEQGDIVLCTVEKISGTTVFVNIDRYGQGRIVLSEIAPGRIRNLRDHVVPKKTIVCKVLKVSGDNLELSLRRVKEKEKKEVLEKYKSEKSFTSVFKTILKEKTQDLIKKIKQEESLFEFVQEAKEDSKKLESLIGKVDSEKILEILNSQKQKTSIIKKEVKITSNAPDGLKRIKDLLSLLKDLEISYLGSAKYSLKIESENAKKATQKIQESLEILKKEGLKKEINIFH